tara:strand:+ start:521 stop:1387 length:867 start_codon:yes stop_codon:yes gene_type:complete
VAVLHRIFWVFAFTLILSGCRLDEMFKQDPRGVFDEPEIYEAADRFAALFESRDAEGLAEMVHPLLVDVFGGSEGMRGIFGQLPEGEIHVSMYFAEPRIGDDRYGDLEGAPLYLFLYDVRINNNNAQLQLVLAQNDDTCCSVTYILLNETIGPPSKYHDFSFANKGPLHYLFAFLLVAMPVFHLVTAVHCGFSKGVVQRKWLWIPFILIGFWGFKFNWTTGEVVFILLNIKDGMVNFSLFNLNLLGAGYLRAGMFTPWIITIALPIGPVWYWIRRARMVQKSAVEDNF